jgi:magnesium-transporting ATPase (P-type)
MGRLSPFLNPSALSSRQVLRVQRSGDLPDAFEEYSVLNILEFTSERRCMSVVVGSCASCSLSNVRMC